MGKGGKVDWSTASRSRFRYAIKSPADGELVARDGSRWQRIHHVEVTDAPRLVLGIPPAARAFALHREGIDDGDVERRVYDADFAERMKAHRLARARRASNWAEQWLALEEEYERRRALAREMLGDWVVDVDLHDGHVAEVEIDARAFVEHGQELLRRAPWVRHLHLSGYPSMGPSFFGFSLLRGMQSLGLAAQALSDEDIEALVASPHLDGLRWLDLSGNRLSHRAFEALASCATLARLEYLGLEDNESESPVDRAGTDAMDGSVVSTTRTQAGRALERLAGRTLQWLHAPARFPTTYPPSPLDVAASG
jgi:hypothetical protein